MSQGFRGLRFLICICLSAYLFISLEVLSILTVIIIIMKCVIYLLAASETPGCERVGLSGQPPSLSQAAGGYVRGKSQLNMSQGRLQDMHVRLFPCSVSLSFLAVLRMPLAPCMGWYT